MADKFTTFAGDWLNETQQGNPDGGAYLLRLDDDREEWFPKSQTTDNEDGTYTIPEWLAKKKLIEDLGD